MDLIWTHHEACTTHLATMSSCSTKLYILTPTGWNNDYPKQEKKTKIFQPIFITSF